MRVSDNDRQPQAQQQQQPVIIKPPELDSVHRLPGTAGQQYEAHIYDLRALTNYTFNVRVAQFVGQAPLVNLTSAVGRLKAARRLDFGKHNANSLSERVETKPFRAEATKCLADVSEVVINTGRYFGGRISVEHSSDPRCSLVGNKTSDQSSYMFRIDHELCNSKIVVSNREVAHLLLR